MNNLIKIILTFIFITNCSLHNNSKFWAKKEIKKEKQEKVIEIFKKKKKFK